MAELESRKYEGLAFLQNKPYKSLWFLGLTLEFAFVLLTWIAVVILFWGELRSRGAGILMFITFALAIIDPYRSLIVTCQRLQEYSLLRVDQSDDEFNLQTSALLEHFKRTLGANVSRNFILAWVLVLLIAYKLS